MGWSCGVGLRVLWCCCLDGGVCRVCSEHEVELGGYDGIGDVLRLGADEAAS
jgi:hypothetical protein